MWLSGYNMIIYMYIYGITGKESEGMKMYRDEKVQGLQWIILFIESFSNVKRISF